MRLTASLLPLLLALSAACSKSNAATTEVAVAPTSIAADGTKQYAIAVGDHGFAPSSVSLAKGEKSALVFTRTSDKTCATAVVFPELKITKDLPMNTAVAIDIPTGDARTLGFECGMGMYKSSVVIK